ncbi:MAG: AAA family ATPase [Methylacidiphilales bacterium]|nr:AAA family ATPase [Candidatus Methylacidiphilales bacterium]
MYLKSLELAGFKSFAPPTAINFHRGVTAIVGPNGCGKSNVLDSIRWVLGETSAKALRGAQMQDVIFGGTDSRKSMGMAEVSMTFADCEKDLEVDFNEVRITRRVFRDGRSEYEINKTPCRLKDIHKLFMDTGIGRSAYSIMEQGKIDQILSSKPEDRRAVFEEAAGITRFKSQKKEALRKLELTEGNLLRVTDIIREVGRQIGSLQRQASKARRYQEVYNRLRDIDTRLAHHTYGELKAKLDHGEALAQNLRRQYEETQSGLETREETVRQRRSEMERLEQNIRLLDQERGNAEGRVQRAGQQITFNRQRIEELESLKERNQAEIAASEEKLRIQREQFESISGEYGRVDVDMQAIRKELDGHKERLDASKRAVSENLETRSRFESQISGIDKAINEARTRMAGIELQKKNYGVRRVKLDEDEALFTQQKSELVAKCEALAQKISSLRSNGVALSSEIESGRTGLAALEAQRNAARASFDETRKQMEELQANARVLEKLIAAHAGYSEPTRKVLESYKNKGVVGTLLDFIKVQPGYEKAVEAALGAACEAVLVESPKILEKILGELGDSGVLAFSDLSNVSSQPAQQPRPEQQMELPLNPLKKFWGRVSSVFGARSSAPAARPAPIEKSREISSTVPSLSSFVSCEGDAGRLALRILNEFLLVENEHDADALRKVRSDRHIVTKRGEIWYREGWQIRGIAREDGQSVFQYENQLLELRKQIEPLSARVQAATREIDGLSSQITDKEQRIAGLQKQKQEMEGQLSGLDYEEKGFLRQQHDAANRLQAVMHERNSLGAQTGTDQEDYKSLEKSLGELAASREEKAREQESLAGQFQQLSQQVEQWTQAVTECRVKEAAALQRLEAIRQQKEAISARLHELEEAVSRLLAETEDYEAKSKQSHQEILDAELDSRKSEEEVAAIAVKIQETASIKEGIQGELVGIEESLRHDRRRATELQTEYSGEEVAVAGQRMKLDALIERINRQYQVDLATWSPSVTAPVEAQPEKAEAATEEGTSESAEGEAISVEGAEPVAEAPSVPEPVQEVEEPDWAALEQEVAELREKLDRMGPVNVEAITEYEELEQRHKFLQTQEQDLIHSRDQLHEAIKKINQTTQVLFAETFAKVQKNFEEMFLEIFGGGKAHLVLQDENDPLECGIDIIARPPGKQLQSISLLSGGERTMTAVALMFAIYMVKPSPFCFLDEMDAPLDESNINRFIRILQRFVKQSQFCVITHNKRTISSADVLYGVTMEEHGVSKIVSVKLSRKEESPLFAENEEHPRSIADSIRGESVLPEQAI